MHQFTCVATPVKDPSRQQSDPHRGLAENVQDSRRAIWEEVLGGVVEPASVPAGDLIFRVGSPPRIALSRAAIVRVFLSGTNGQQLTIRLADVAIWSDWPRCSVAAARGVLGYGSCDGSHYPDPKSPTCF